MLQIRIVSKQRLKQQILSHAFAGALITATSSLALANGLTDFPGAIPLDYTRTEATDLLYNGVSTTPDQLNQLRISKHIDLSTLDPQASDIWPKKQITQDFTINANGEVFTYVSDVPSQVGNYRFSVTRISPAGVPQSFTIIASKQVHNILLRKALLDKLGYSTPQVSWLRNFTVKFNGAFSRKVFIDSLKANTFGEAERWVLNPNDVNSDSVLMQDAVVVSADDSIYNLSLGALTSEVIQGRRVLNALLVPYNLVDVPESMNLFTWDTGRITNEMIYLPYALAEEFNPSFSDAKWITRRIGQLTRADIVAIVKSAQLPEDVSALAVEKIISRRNILLSRFGFTNAALPFDSKISYGANLVRGKLTLLKYPGYASRFAYGDPPAPITPAEIAAYFKSRVYSAGISNLIAQFNAQLKTDIAKSMLDHQQKLAEKGFINYLETGKVQKTPLGLVAFPTFSGNLLISRDVITGSYLGTDNLVQMADTFGFLGSAGVYVGVDGLPAKLSVNGQAYLSLGRSYTHIKPISSIKASLSEDFKNVFVVLLQQDFAKTLDAVVSTPNGQTDADTQKKLGDAIAAFKKGLGVGESLLVTDTFSRALGVGIGYDLVKNVALQGQLSDAQISIGRLQVFRKSENVIQIYRDPADYNVAQISIGLNALIQVVEIDFSHKQGSATTNFYTLNIEPDLSKNSDAIKNAKALRQVLMTNRTAAVDALEKPFSFEHDFQEDSSGGHFLLWRWLNLDTTDYFHATDPNGYKKDFLYSATAWMTGHNYEELATNVANKILTDLANSPDVGIKEPGNILPGAGILGDSVSRRVSFEAEVQPAPMAGLSELFADVAYQWKGWEISTNAVLKIIKDMSDKYSFQFYPPDVLQTTKSLQLYSIDLHIFIYTEGLLKLSNASVDAVHKMLIAEGKWSYLPEFEAPGTSHPGPSWSEIRDENERLMNVFFMEQKEFKKAMAKLDYKASVEHGTRMAASAEALFSVNDFIQLCGGAQNLYIQSRLSGFRNGDENGDTGLISNSLGSIGSQKISGPLHYIQQNLDMTESEFFIYWILNKI